MIDALRKVIKRMHFPLDVMLTCVRWYAAYPLSLRSLGAQQKVDGVAVAVDRSVQILPLASDL